MRICLISREYPPDTGWGGIGAYAYQHARALKKLGHDVEVVALTAKESVADGAPAPDPADPFYVPVHRAVWGELFQDLATLWISVPHAHFTLKSVFALWRRFLEVHSEKPFDVIEAPEHLAEGLFPALTGICPLVIRLHTPHSKLVADGYHNLSPTFDHRLVSILERTAMLQADLLSSPSRDLAAFVAQDCGIAENSILFVPNPVDVDKFAPEGDLPGPRRSGVNVYFAGRLEERKGIQYLIDAVPTILAKCPDAHFTVVGADTDTGPGHTSVLAELQRRLAASGCTEAVNFVGKVAHESMPAYYRSADICVVPSLYENAPYTVLEAQASGKPVVTTSAGGSKEYVVDGVTGRVVPARDSAALAQAIIELIQDPDKRDSMGRAARDITCARFANRVVAEEALRTYELAIERHQQSAQRFLYQHNAEKSLFDFVSLLHSYHKNLCNLIARHSLIFRLKHRVSMFVNRPRLFAAKAAVSILKKPAAAFGGNFTAAVTKLDARVRAQEAERDRLELAALLEECRAYVNPKLVRANEEHAKRERECAST